jgi:N-acetylmuramoyl-L-alanine amidase
VRRFAVACAALAALAAGSLVRAQQPAHPVPPGLGVPSIPVSRVAGIDVVGANDLARLLGASRSWRADVRKLVLHLGEHRLTFTEGAPFVLVDDRTLRLDHEVVARAGELQIPAGLARAMPEGGGWPRLEFDAEASELRAAPAEGYVGPLRVTTRGGLTELRIPCAHAEAAAVVGRTRARFRLRVPGALLFGALPDSLPDDGLLRDLNVTALGSGLRFELAVDGAAGGWRLERAAEGGAVSLILARAGSDFEPFAPEPPPGSHALRTVVLDPGHGGNDTGVRSDGVQEKTLTLDLARVLAEELRRRAGVRVWLTRSEDRDMSQLVRSELMNRPDPDLVLSLHFGMSTDPRARGGAVWCAPATVPPAAASAAASGSDAVIAANRPPAGRAPVTVLEMLPWRDAAAAHAVESRGLAEVLAGALERQGFGPLGVHERMPVSLIGVSAPGVMLECGTLSNPEERGRLLAPASIRKLAAAIADGLIAWQRGE